MEERQAKLANSDHQPKLGRKETLGGLQKRLNQRLPTLKIEKIDRSSDFSELETKPNLVFLPMAKVAG